MTTHRPEVDLLVGVNAGKDEEYARPLGSARPQPAQPEYHGPLVLLHHLDGEEERDWEREEDEQEGEHGQQQGAAAGTRGVR